MARIGRATGGDGTGKPTDGHLYNYYKPQFVRPRHMTDVHGCECSRGRGLGAADPPSAAVARWIGSASS